MLPFLSPTGPPWNVCYIHNMNGRSQGQPNPQDRALATGGKGRPAGGRGERKAVLNVTISESLAEEVRMEAALEHTTISSVVERALAEQVRWEVIRREGLAAIDAYYRDHGYPTDEETAAAGAQVAEEERLIDEARAALEAERGKRGRQGRKRPA